MKGINDETNIAVACKPGGMVLIANLVAVTDAVFFDRAVTANIKDGRRGFFEPLRDVQIGRNVKAGSGLKVNLLDDKLVTLDFAGDDVFEVGFFRERVKAKHLEELLSINLAFVFPVIEVLYVREAPLRELCGFAAKIFGEHSVALAGTDCPPIRTEALKANAQD